MLLVHFDLPGLVGGTAYLHVTAMRTASFAGKLMTHRQHEQIALQSLWAERHVQEQASGHDMRRF